MPLDDEIPVSPEISEEFTSFEEFCSENTGRELQYLEVVGHESPCDGLRDTGLQHEAPCSAVQRPDGHVARFLER